MIDTIKPMVLFILGCFGLACLAYTIMVQWGKSILIEIEYQWFISVALFLIAAILAFK